MTAAFPVFAALAPAEIASPGAAAVLALHCALLQNGYLPCNSEWQFEAQGGLMRMIPAVLIQHIGTTDEAAFKLYYRHHAEQVSLFVSSESLGRGAVIHLKMNDENRGAIQFEAADLCNAGSGGVGGTQFAYTPAGRTGDAINEAKLEEVLAEIFGLLNTRVTSNTASYARPGGGYSTTTTTRTYTTSSSPHRMTQVTDIPGPMARLVGPPVFRVGPNTPSQVFPENPLDLLGKPPGILGDDLRNAMSHSIFR